MGEFNYKGFEILVKRRDTDAIMRHENRYYYWEIRKDNMIKSFDSAVFPNMEEAELNAKEIVNKIYLR